MSDILEDMEKRFAKYLLESVKIQRTEARIAALEAMVAEHEAWLQSLHKRADWKPKEKNS